MRTLALLFVILISFSSLATASNNEMYLVASEDSVDIGDTFNITVFVDVEDEINTIYLDLLEFDGSVVQCTDVTRGSFFSDVEFWYDGYVNENNVTNVTWASNNERDGAGVFATYTFLANSSGNITITISKARIAKDSICYDLTVQNRSINVKMTQEELLEYIDQKNYDILQSLQDTSNDLKEQLTQLENNSQEKNQEILNNISNIKHTLDAINTDISNMRNSVDDMFNENDAQRLKEDITDMFETEIDAQMGRIESTLASFNNTLSNDIKHKDQIISNMSLENIVSSLLLIIIFAMAMLYILLKKWWGEDG